MLTINSGKFTSQLHHSHFKVALYLSINVLILWWFVSVLSLYLSIFLDICLGGDTKNPEGTIKILAEKAGLQGTFLEAANYYVINVSTLFYRNISES
jgi:hypothetical protein